MVTIKQVFAVSTLTQKGIWKIKPTSLCCSLLLFAVDLFCSTSTNSNASILLELTHMISLERTPIYGAHVFLETSNQRIPIDTTVSIEFDTIRTSLIHKSFFFRSKQNLSFKYGQLIK